MEGYCSTGQRPQWAVVPMEEEEEEFSTEYPALQFANHCTFMKSLLNIQCHNFAKYFKLKEFLIDYPRL
jgi:hypothetical protein